MKILFIGETWSGSSARSMRDALSLLPDVNMVDLGEDHYFPKAKSRFVRAANRLLRPWHRAELASEIESKVASFRPDVLMIYKGSNVAADIIRKAKRAGIFTVNVFPDCSPHAQGDVLQNAIGEYDLVASTKPFHPPGWTSLYGYSNRCVFVPHGYDPVVHYWAEPASIQDFDIVVGATWRPEYENLLRQFWDAVPERSVRVCIAGLGWRDRASLLPADWKLEPAHIGRAYGELMRRGRIVIAPVQRLVVINGVRQPGDEDSTRSYELAAMGCFFLHSRTNFARTIYDQDTEVPMWDDARELAKLVRHFLPLQEERYAMAARTHSRAVPAYSITGRAIEVLEQVKIAMNN